MVTAPLFWRAILADPAMSQFTSNGVQQCGQADGVSIRVYTKKPLSGTAQPVSGISA